MNQDEIVLRKLLRGKDERAFLQSIILAHSDCLVQITLNIPGYPKRVANDIRAVSVAETLATDLLRSKSNAGALLVNEAGVALLSGFNEISPIEVKKSMIEIEERYDWCRALDIDVITADGPLSRTEFGHGPRLCIICADDSKVCARLQRHNVADLRARVRRMIESIDG